MDLLSLLVYIPLQIACIPAAIVAGMWVGYKQVVVSKKMGISQTAIEVLNGRWTMHVFDIRTDEATARIANVLPNTSTVGLWIALFPLWVKHKIAGRPSIYPRVPQPGAENVADLMIARTLYFDRIIGRVQPDVEQFVVLGAGYDMRAYGQQQRQSLTCFELDQSQVQQHKREMLAAADIPSEHVVFVSVDFSQDSVFDELLKAGFDPSKKTLFLWEGVTLYLSANDIRRTLADIRHHAPQGSVLLADFYAERFTNISKPKAVKKVLEYTDEGLRFSLDFASDHLAVLTDFVSGESMSVGETFFLGHTHRQGPYAVVAELTW